MGKAHSTMSGKPTGPRFDSSTGQPIPKFDPTTGKQNWWDEEGSEAPPQAQPVSPVVMPPAAPQFQQPVMMQPGMMMQPA